MAPGNDLDPAKLRQGVRRLGKGTGGTLATAFARGGNNLDLIRLGAALLVLASHAYVLTGHAADEPIGIATNHLVDGGSLAVAVFFILSGFLIARSAQRHTPGAYLRARVLRLYPAFLLAVVAQTFVLGPVLTTLSLGAYFGSALPWSALLRALAFSTPPTLPGVFDQNQVPSIVNGSLWTLRIEALCYLGILALSLAGLLRPGRMLAPLATGWLALAAIVAARSGLLPPVVAHLQVVAITDCALNFLMGAVLWVYAKRIPHSAWLAGAGGLAIMVAAPTQAGPIVLHVALPYLVLWLGLSRAVVRPATDISYGTYLYAFPVQQTLVAALAPTTPLLLTVLALPPTLILAAISHACIERPALRFKSSPAPS